MLTARCGCPGWPDAAALAGLRGGGWRRQPILLAQPFLHDLLHRLSFFVRRLDGGGGGGFFSPGSDTIGLTGALARRTEHREAPLVGPAEPEAEAQAAAGGRRRGFGTALLRLVVPAAALAVARRSRRRRCAGFGAAFASTSGSGRFGFDLRCSRRRRRVAPAGLFLDRLRNRVCDVDALRLLAASTTSSTGVCATSTTSGSSFLRSWSARRSSTVFECDVTGTPMCCNSRMTSELSRFSSRASS